MNINILYSGQNGELLKKHIESHIYSLDKISDIKDNIEVEVLSRQKAIQILKNIFQLTEKPNEQDKEDNKKKYGL